jgi:hypothetical protein
MRANYLEKASAAAILANGAAFLWGVVDPLHAAYADAAEHAFLAFFVAEMGLRWRAAGWRLAHFRGWELFDAIVVLLSVASLLPGSAVARMARLAKLVKVLHLGRHAAQLRVLALARN